MTNPAVVQVLDAIATSEKVVVVSHTNPDADAYGSSCGLALGLRAFGKDVSVYNDHGFIPRYQIIPGAEGVIKGAWPQLGPQDLLIVVDCGAEDRVGDELVQHLRQASTVVNIDHHASNSLFGTINFVVEQSSSTCELIFEVLRSLEKETNRQDIITKSVAECLLSGIIGDTGSFRYPSTTPRTFRVAAELVERGARLDVLAQELFATQSIVALRLQSEALGAVRLHPNGFAEVIVTQEMLKKHKAEILDAESLAERARDIEGVKVSALYKQDVDLWRISLRSRRGVVDVSTIAQNFGGGGHRAAAAFRWREGLDSLQEKLQASIATALESANTQ